MEWHKCNKHSRRKSGPFARGFARRNGSTPPTNALERGLQFCVISGARLGEFGVCAGRLGEQPSRADLVRRVRKDEWDLAHPSEQFR